MTCAGAACFLARLGYAARGVVYITIGLLAAFAALGRGDGETTGPRGALATVRDVAWGQTLLAVLGVGLLAYALWRLAQAVLNVDSHKNDAKGITVRVGMLISSVVHTTLAAWVFTTLWTGRSAGDEGDAKSQAWIAWGLGLPGGRVLVIIAGVIVIAVGVTQGIRGWRAKFEKRLDFDYQRWSWARPICRFGLIARGFVFILIGGSLLRAAYRYTATEARGMGTVLGELQRQPWGTALLGIAALGLIAFGLYGLIEARYRKIDLWPAR